MNPPDRLKSQVTEVLEALLGLAQDPLHRYAFTKAANRVSPIEFIMIGVFHPYHLFERKLTSMQASYCTICGVRRMHKKRQIDNIRQVTRASHTDVRSNAKVWTTMKGYILRVKEGGVQTFGKKAERATKRRKTNDSGSDD
jgi:hypothetical protein